MPKNVQKQAFLYARDVLLKIYKEEFDTELTDKWKKWNDIILGKKYYAWKALTKI